MIGNCPCCDNPITLGPDVVKDYQHFQCKNCFHEFFTSTASDATIVNNTLYQEDTDYTNDLSISDYGDLIQWNHLRALRFLTKTKDIKTVLDVGAYNGFFVKSLREKGFEAYGYDFNAKAIKSGIIKYELDGIITSNLNDIQFKKYDCITAFEVIEHLENPKHFIGQFSNLLKDGGYLILSCPNNKLLWRPPLDYPPHHLARYSPFSLTVFIEKMGYEVIKHDEQMSLFDLIRNFVGVFFRDKNKSSLKGGQFKELKVINYLKTGLNKSRPFFYFLFFLFDKLLHSFGFRYISQAIIAKKIKQ